MDEKEKRAKLVRQIVGLFNFGKLGGHATAAEMQTEAEAAATKARALMTEYAITEAELEAHSEKGKRAAQIIAEAGCYTLKRGSFAKYDHAVAYAVDAICHTRNYVKTSYVHGQIHVTRMFFGTETDTAVATALFMALMNQMKAAAKRLYGSSWGPMHSSYSLGWAVKVMQRARAADTEHQLSDGQRQTLALVVRDKNAALDEHSAKIGLVKAKSRRAKVKDPHAFQRGTEDGSFVDLGNPKRRI